MKSLISLFVLLGFLAGCSLNNTRMIQSWANPELKSQPIHFNKILVVAVAPSDTERRSAEDAMAVKVGPKATPSYTVLTEAELKDAAAAKARIQASGYDGVVLLRWLGFRQEKEVMGAPTYSPLWDQYSYSWTYMQESTVVEWKILQLETRIFSALDEKLIWTGTTESVEPGSIPKLIEDVAVVVKKQLTTQGLLPAAPEKPKNAK